MRADEDDDDAEDGRPKLRPLGRLLPKAQLEG
jgi:hypothetical protein